MTKGWVSPPRHDHLSSLVFSIMSNLDPCIIYNRISTFDLIIFFFHSHDDVIGKITLSKDAIGSQAKGETTGT